MAGFCGPVRLVGMDSKRVILLGWCGFVLVGCGSAASDAGATASGGAAADAGMEASGGSEVGANEDPTVVDGDKRSAIAAFGDAQHFLSGLDQQNATRMADELLWLSITPNYIASVSTGDPIYRDTILTLNGELGSASCAGASCTYQNYAVPRGDETEVFTGGVSRSIDGTTVTIDMKLSATGWAIEDDHVTGVFQVTPTLLDGVIQFRSPVVGGTTVDTLRFNQVTRSDPPTAGSIELDRVGPLGHYRTTIALP